MYTVQKCGSPGMQVYKGFDNLNEIYLGVGSAGVATGTNRYGQAAYGAQSADLAFHVMVDGHDYFNDVYGHDNNPSRDIVTSGVDDTGQPLWYTYVTGQKAHVYKGTQELSAGLSISTGGITLNDISANGYAVWTGYDSTEGVFDVYRNTENISKAVLPSTRSVALISKVSPKGDVLWVGNETPTSRADMYINYTKVTGNMADLYFATPLGMTASGHYFWTKQRTGVVGKHLWRDQEDISALVFGDTQSSTMERAYFNESGDVLWLASTRDGVGAGVYLNTTLLSDILGTFDRRNITGVDGAGNAVWWGAGETTGHKTDVFVNKFDLTKDALGENYYHARAVAVNEKGQVLWFSSQGDDDFSVWLSTPVPEPSLIVPPSLVLGIMLRRCCSPKRARAA